MFASIYVHILENFWPFLPFSLFFVVTSNFQCYMPDVIAHVTTSFCLNNLLMPHNLCTSHHIRVWPQSLMSNWVVLCSTMGIIYSLCAVYDVQFKLFDNHPFLCSWDFSHHLGLFVGGRAHLWGWMGMVAISMHEQLPLWKKKNVQ